MALGLWEGEYQGVRLPWLRGWDGAGQLLLTGHERADRAQEEGQRADRAQERADRLAAQLRALGVDPDAPPGS